jgi:hypothetical protein
MESKNINQVMSHYLQEMLELYHRDDSPGINDYCTVLKDLLYSSFEFLPGSISKENVEIEILENPEDLRIHIPRIRIWDGKAKVYGYIDVLGPVSTKKVIKSYLFTDLYKRLFTNLIITDFFEFRYYRGAQKVCTSRPFPVSSIGALTNKTKVTSTRLFLKQLQHFMVYSGKKSKVPSFIRLQKRLALKTYYLKEFLLTPLMKYLIYKGIKGELFRLYRAYCYFFNRELSIEEFSAFLSHVIIDGFLRAGIFYSTTNSKGVAPAVFNLLCCRNTQMPEEKYRDDKKVFQYSNTDNGKPFSRCRVFKFAKYNRMPDRRLAVFKYLSPGSGDDQLPTAVKWMLDDISTLLLNFDFKQMCFHWKNPMLIDGELLQWESYFFKPYYENEEYKRVRELLQKGGIFSGVINDDKHEKLFGPVKNETERKKMNGNAKKWSGTAKNEWERKKMVRNGKK